MEPHYRIRIYILTILVLFGCGTLLTRLHEFQIDKQDFYKEQLPGSKEVRVRVPGVRGAIVDRNGLELARNKANYEVTFNLEEIRKAYLEQKEKSPRRNAIAKEDGMPRETEETDIVKIVNQRIIPALDKLGLTVNYRASQLRAHYVTHHGLVPFSYRADLTYEEFARFAEHSVELPGVSLNVRPQREYPYGSLCCHILGYVQDWDKAYIPEKARLEFDHYVGDAKGKEGVEAVLDEQLRGKEGRIVRMTNEKGKVLPGNLDTEDPEAGAKVTLTIDAGVQHLVSNALRHAGTAGAVVMDVRTGEILAMASVPDYDPNDFIPRLSLEKRDFYYQNEPLTNKPLFDVCVMPAQPGSTFKIPTAIAGSISGLDDRTYTCTGGVSFGSATVRCWISRPPHPPGGSHGPLTLTKGIKFSCNPFFMQLAGGVGNKRMVDTFHMLGFGAKTGIPVTGERAGIVIGDRSWTERFGRKVTPVDNALLAIGQAEAEATPLQICAMLSAVANGGRYYEPRLVKEIVAADGKVLVEDKPRLKVDLLKEGVKAADIATMHKGMWMAANEQGGTAYRMKMKDYEVGAKTGTAQAPPLPHEKEMSHNAWTMCFAPYNDPHYAVVVLVRNGAAGGLVAAPIAKIIVTGLKARDEGKILPVHPLEPVVGNLKEIKEIPLPDDILGTLDISDDGETGDEAVDAGAVPSDIDDAKPIVPAPLVVPEVDAEGTVVPRSKSKPPRR